MIGTTCLVLAYQTADQGLGMFSLSCLTSALILGTSRRRSGRNPLDEL